MTPGRLCRRAGLWAVTAVLTGCGGGLWIGFGDSDWDDSPPSVSLVATSPTVTAGGTLRVVAAAADDSGIDRVAFYRRDAIGWTFLGSDPAAPYEWFVPVPADGRSVLEVFARATDRAGLEADSDVLQVPVGP